MFAFYIIGKPLSKVRRIKGILFVYKFYPFHTVCHPPPPLADMSAKNVFFWTCFIVITILYLRAVELPLELVEHDPEAEGDTVGNHIDEEGGCDHHPAVPTVRGRVTVRI